MERVAALWVGGTSEVTLGAARLVIVLALLAPPTRHWFLDAGFRWSYIVVVAFTVSLFLVPLVRRYAIWREVFDQPAARKVHMVATPLLGGAGVYLAFAITVLANFHFSMTLKGVALGASVVVALGILDDVADLPAWVKLLGQIGGGPLPTLHGGVLSVGPSWWPGAVVVNILLMLLGVPTLTKALQVLDRLDGLAPGLGGIPR